MARFLISPGVVTREIDQSQYTATTGAGNVAALIGYSEKGPFEPTVVTSQQDFVETFGSTLADAPYLAQAAYKFFEEGDQLLVVRAGDSRDPETTPTAAQFADKVVRVPPFTPDETTATAGYQAFSSTSGASAGSFTPDSTYGFRVLADHMAFKTPKTIETWQGMAAETANSIGQPVPYTGITNTVFKTAFPVGSTTGAFVGHYKEQDTAVASTTSEYRGTSCSRSGITKGSTVSATLTKYVMEGTSLDDASDIISIAGIQGAAALGTVNLDGGYDFSVSNESFIVTLGSVDTLITLDASCGSIDDIVSELNNKFTAEGINGAVVASKMVPASGESYVVIKHIGSGTETSLTLADGVNDALAIMGLEAKTYADADYISGTWHAEMPGGVASFDGDFVFEKVSTETSAISFEEVIDISVQAPAAGDWSLNDMITQINAELALAYDGSHTDNGLAYTYTAARATASLGDGGKIRITAIDDASATEASMVSISEPSTGSSFISLVGVDNPVEGDVGEPASGEALITIKAKEKGSYGNKLTLRTETKVINYGLTSETRKNVYVLLDGNEVSVYQKVNWTNPADSNYILTRLASDKYVVLESADEDQDDILAALPDGDYLLGSMDLPQGLTQDDAQVLSANVGTNGWTEVGDVITSMSADFSNALTKISNAEVYEFNLVAAPGGADPIVQNAIQSLCDSRRDCFGVIDAAPFGLGLGIKENINDITEVNEACSTITSSYVGAFWPWLQDYDSDNAQYVWLPPSTYALRQMVYTDNVADPWYAPAGTTRGRVTALDVEYSATRVDRDLLYGETAIVNPIVKFVNEGITIWGQKTGQRTLTATNRINVRRLLIYTEKLIARMARGFLFEPNDTANYAAFARQANAILEPIRQRRGLYTYQVVCDESTNTADLVNQNIMAGKIFVQPTKTVEFIEVNFTILPSGEVEIEE